jgi:hypothetical protein
VASRFPCNFLDQSLHRHALCDKARSGLIHRPEQATPCFIDPRNLPHVDFDWSAEDRCGTPGVFGFGNPRASESPCKMQAPSGALILNCDSQHFGFPDSPSKAHGQGQVSQLRNQLSANELKAQSDLVIRLLIPGSGHDASNRAAVDATVEADTTK